MLVVEEWYDAITSAEIQSENGPTNTEIYHGLNTSVSAMKSRRYKVSEDCQSILERHSPRFSAEEYSFPIPVDLMIEIFLRLTVKSIARCRCVSKLWGSILSRPDFTKSFLAMSRTLPRLLFACKSNKHGGFFFSSPQPQNNPDEKSSPLLAMYHMKTHSDHINCKFKSTSGFVFVSDTRILEGRKTEEVVWVIYNPSTGQSCTLPKMKTRKRVYMENFLGYDPIENQHKVLAMSLTRDERAAEHQVLTLGGTEKLTWRKARCGIPHYRPMRCDICINGVLYYRARSKRSCYIYDVVVCFDVRSEKYKSIKLMGRLMQCPHATLLNYKGKLASLFPNDLIAGTASSLEMWVLEDAEKHEWSTHVYTLPATWKSVIPDESLNVVGVTGANEIVLAENYASSRFSVYYYNFERDTVTRVEIQGIKEGPYRVDTFLNHVEDVKLLF